MKDYTIQNGQYYKVTDKDSGKLISIGELNDGDILSTIHDVEFMDHHEYMNEINNIVVSVSSEE
ncbi:hypothetical protein [Acinetobacter soli]|uniref:hypothetical protein n=1 Tax=Acinetobacter soli TaxID=487316 RepID=UPI0012316CB6|nr:hypothetical protein [Acinetobacter soli]